MRGQTTLDFSIGMCVFLIAVTFVFAFIPGMLEPFSDGPQEETVVVERATDQLVESVLAGDRAYVLNESCTTEFFNASHEGGDCGFDRATTTPGELLGVTDANLNVTVERDGAVQCLDPSSGQAGDCATVGHTELNLGPSPEGSSSSVLVAYRVASLAGTDVQVYVRVW